MGQTFASSKTSLCFLGDFEIVPTIYVTVEKSHSSTLQIFLWVYRMTMSIIAPIQSLYAYEACLITRNFAQLKTYLVCFCYFGKKYVPLWVIGIPSRLSSGSLGWLWNSPHQHKITTEKTHSWALVHVFASYAFSSIAQYALCFNQFLPIAV